MTDDRRAQIIRAARALLIETPSAELAVRTVAERAGMGASTLRHYFPSQRELREAVYADLFTVGASDLGIGDTTRPARERLRECLLQLLPPPQPLDLPVDRWTDVLSSVFGSTGTAEARTAWGSSIVWTRRKISEWLHVLSAEGAVVGGSEERGARLLLTVLDGLTYARVIPVARLEPAEEDAVLQDALTAVLRTR